MNAPDTIARDLADHAAGQPLEVIQAHLILSQTALNVWLKTYAAALASPHQQPDHRPPYTVKEVAARLNCSPTTVREMVLEGRISKLPGLGSAIRIPRADIDRILEGAA